MSDRPQAFGIVAGPSLREIELAMTDPWPLGRPIGTADNSLLRLLVFTIISADGRQIPTTVQIWMIRHVGLPSDMMSSIPETSLDLGLILWGSDMRSIFNPADENNDDLDKLLEDADDIAEVPALYDYERKQGRIVLTNPPWRKLRS